MTRRLRQSALGSMRKKILRSFAGCDRALLLWGTFQWLGYRLMRSHYFILEEWRKGKRNLRKSCCLGVENLIWLQECTFGCILSFELSQFFFNRMMPRINYFAIPLTKAREVLTYWQTGWGKISLIPTERKTMIITVQRGNVALANTKLTTCKQSKRYKNKFIGD